MGEMVNAQSLGIVLVLGNVGWAGGQPAGDARAPRSSPAVAGVAAKPDGTGSAGPESPGGFRLDRAELTEPLVTDRPDFTESTDAVPRGHLQLESGYTFTYDREEQDRVHDHTAPELLLRISPLDNFELRLGWAGYSWTQSQFEGRTRADRRVTREEWEQGANDLSLGFKVKLVEQQGWRPHFGVIGQISVPSGSPSLSSGDVDPEVKLLWAYDLGERVALSGNVNLAVPTEDSHRFVQTAASLSLGVSLTEWLGTYVEYFGFYPNAHSTDAAHYLNGGFTFPIHRDFQIDLRAGAGLNEEADDFFTGVGFAWRL